MTELPNAIRPGQRSGSLHAAIARAKQEWECTVDALPQLVCVLDGSATSCARIARSKPGRSARCSEVQGRTLHQLLHPGMRRQHLRAARTARCVVAVPAARAAPAFRTGRPGARALSQRDAPADVGGRHDEAGSAGNLAVIVLSDITELQQHPGDLQAMNEQLESRIEARTHELNASRDELSMLSAG